MTDEAKGSECDSYPVPVVPHEGKGRLRCG